MRKSRAVRSAQIQQHVQRQAAQFCARVAEAMEPLEQSPSRRVSDSALEGVLLYTSSAIDIATGPFPEVNLVDLLVFLRLGLHVLERHWIPQVYREGGHDVAAAFRKSEEAAWDVARGVLDEAERTQLVALVDAWLADNPDQVRVEDVRLDDFSLHAGQVASEHAERARGLLSSVHSATETADQALFLAERAMFLAHRAPFLVRMQARLASRQILSDAIVRILSAPRDLWSQSWRRVGMLFRRSLAGFRQLGAPHEERG
jgi:hypothetical protein